MQQTPSPNAATNGHHHVFPSAAEMTAEMVGRLESPSPRTRGLLWVFGLLMLAGFVGLALRIAGGFSEAAPWGYTAAVFSYILITAQSAPVVAVALRLVKADWRRPVTRVAELLAVAGVLNLILFLPLLAALPPLAGRLNIWMEWTLLGVDYSRIWDLLGLLGLVVLGLALLYVAAIPDFATLREHSTGSRQRLYARLARGWQGTPRQWEVLRTGVGILGAFYFILLVGVHFLISVDFSMSMIPGWWSAIYPAQQALSGLQNAVAVTLVALLLMRSFGGLRRYLGVDPYWGLSKLLLALTLMWFYFWWAEFLTIWYGRSPREQMVLELLMFGPYAVPFFLAFLLNFAIPFLLLIWNPIRKSVMGPPLVGVSILVGTFFDRIRLYVGPFSIEEHISHEFEHMPATLLPGVPDLLIIVGFLAGAVWCFLLATRFLPPLNLWEMREGLVLRVPRRLLRMETVVVGKPR